MVSPFQARTIPLCVFCISLFACAPDPTQPGGFAVAEVAAGSALPARLIIEVAGLPSGAPAAVTVSGPEAFLRSISRTDTLAGLNPGKYTIVAAPVEADGHRYRQVETTYVVEATAGSSTTVPETYRLISGVLAIEVSGLPTGAEASVLVTGTGVSLSVRGSVTLKGLAPGKYTITASSRPAEGVTYEPEPVSQFVELTASLVPEVRLVTYVPAPPPAGGLNLAISGLPTGLGAAVTVSGPGGFNRVVTGTITLTALVAGTYTVSSAEVVGPGVVYRPAPAVQTIQVSSGSAVATVIYSLFSAGPVVTMDSTKHYQVIEGWEALAQAGQEAPGFAGWQDTLLGLAADDLGISRLRLEVRAGSENPRDGYVEMRKGALPWRCERYLIVNDNADPYTIDPAGFHFSEVDTIMTTIVMPLRQRLAARGERLFVTLNYVAFLGQCPPTAYVHGDAEEYAEFMLAAFQHLQERYGFVPDALEIILEPDNVAQWSPAMIGRAILATRARLGAAGFAPEFIAPSTTDMGRAVSWFDALRAVPGMAGIPLTLSYQRYAGVSTANLAAIGQRRLATGVRTAMLEHVAGTAEELYQDLTIGLSSAWLQYRLAMPMLDTGAQYYTILDGKPVMGSRTRYLRQYFKYVRPGALRIGAASSSTAYRPVAFQHARLGLTVVIHADQAGPLTVRGLPAGEYGVSITTDSVTGMEMARQTAGSLGTIVLAVPARGVLTVHRLP